MAKKEIFHYIKTTRSFLRSNKTKNKYRVSEKDFTRSRKLSFDLLALCMLKLIRKTIQIELHNFFSQVGKSVESITASAFVQSRKKIKPDLFYDLNKLIVNEFYTDNDESVKLYKGLRILSIDGSSIQLPLNKKIKEMYGTFNNQKTTDDVVIARVSVLYDLLNNIVIDGKLAPFKSGEVTLSREHFIHAQKGDLIIMDRAYPSFQSIYLLNEKEIHFLYRCKTGFSNEIQAFYESGKTDEIIEIKPTQNRSFKDHPYEKDSRIPVRAIRLTLSSGETEILITSLFNKVGFPYIEFKELYFKRWKVETFYNRFKNIIGVENFTGTSDQFIQQEFNCALYMSNLQTLFTNEATLEINEKCAKRKYEYKVNSTLSLGFIRERLMKIFLSKKEPEQQILELKELFVQHLIPIRNDRNFERNVNKYRQRTKPKQFRNRKQFL